MKFISIVFVIAVSMSPVIAEDYADGKVSIDKGENLDALNSYPKAAREGYCKAKLHLSLVYDLKNINIEDFLSCSIETE